MDMPYAQADKIAKLIPNDLKMTIDKALEQEERLKTMVKEDQQVARLIEISRTLEGTSRHASTHAAGVVISPSDLTDFMPLYKPSGSDDITTQFTMNHVESLGLLKMDFLGLRTLTVMDNTVKLIRAAHDPTFSIDDIPLEDEATFELLASAKTQGVFQLESEGMRDLIRKMKPTLFSDIIALVALFRPGPINSGMADQYVRRKHGHEEVTFDFPVIEQTLSETYGVIVYQEQVMKIANELSGFSMAQADSLRKAMGKKVAAIMAEQRDMFVDGAVAKGEDKAKVEALWSNIEKFAEYGFNKSHSACYALVAYQTAYLKAHYTAEYMASLISSEKDNSDKVIRYLQELRELGIEAAPPDVNESMSDFAVINGAVRFGLAAIKGVGVGSVEGIIAARNEGGRFTSLLDFAERVEPGAVNKRVYEALIKCGAFDSFETSRAALFAGIDAVCSAAQRTQKDKAMGQTSIFGSMPDAVSDAAPSVVIADLPEWPERERLAHEKEALGFYISGHPLNAFARDLQLFATHSTDTILQAPNKSEVRIGGIIAAKRIQTTKKKGESYARITIEDMAGSVEVLVWPKTYQNVVEILDSEDPIFIIGKLEVDDQRTQVIADEIITFHAAKQKFTNTVAIHLTTTGLERESLEQLRDILDRRRGSSVVKIYFKAPGKGELVMRAPHHSVAADDDLIAEIEDLIGERSVHLE
jgi:DNA polymerase-3 subunit alpha